MMKKLCMMALAGVLSLGVASVGYAQAPADKKMEEKKGDMKGEAKGDMKDAKKAPAKKAPAKKDNGEKKAANPCAAKAPEKK
jgi:trigger factor